MTTLDKIAPKNHFHLYAEHKGLRYYLGSCLSYNELALQADLLARRLKLPPTTCLYITDKTGSTAINGDLAAFEASLSTPSLTAGVR
jgi:hypothetical protein